MAEENAMQAGQMSFRARLIGAWEHSDSLVCVGLDPDFDRLPNRFRGQEMPYFEFCREVVDATAAHVAAFKPQHAHFAAFGREAELERLIQYIKTELQLKASHKEIYHAFKVWPQGFAETFCVDHWRCRFTTENIPLEFSEVLELQHRLIEAGFDVVKTENLYNFGDEPGYAAVHG